MTNNFLKLIKLENNIYQIIFDNVNEKLNIINAEFLNEFNVCLDEISNDTLASGIILSSAKKNSFIVGADIKAISDLQKQSIIKAYEASMMGRSVFQRLNGLKPVKICLINGMCLGGGLELTLFCDYRIGNSDSDSVLGLPEVKLGILPAWGGCVNLPKLTGLTQALNLILTSKLINFKKALKLGILDELVEEDKLLDRAISVINQKSLKKTARPISYFFESNILKIGLVRNQLINQVKKSVQKTTKGFYPAPYKVIEVMKNVGMKSSQSLYEKESLAFSELLHSHVAKSILNIYFAQNESKKNDHIDSPLTTIGVVGAGVMGAGIAQALAFANFKVVLKDVNQDFLNRGIGIIDKLFLSLVEKKKITNDNATDFKANIKPTLDYADFSTCDLVIEAVIEDMNSKIDVLNEITKVNKQEFIFATNTSSLSVEELASKANDKSKVIGIHFFNPVHKMNLVEIIKTSHTTPNVLTIAKALVLKLNKTPVIANSAPGFIVNRILGPYLNEAVLLAIAKVPIENIDKAMKKFGMPMGPFELLDEVGLDVAFKVSHILHEAFGDRMQPVALFNDLIESKSLGKKTKLGIYQYDDKLKKTAINPAVLQLIYQASSREIIEQKLNSHKSNEEIIDRLVMVMINEALRCLADGVVVSASSLDLAMVFGTGFAPFYGGLLCYADYLGLEVVYQKLLGLASVSGLNYEVQPILLDLIKNRQTIYERFN